MNLRNEESQNIQFPLESLLVLYENASHADVFPNYMEGFKLLADWLGPIEIPSNLEIVNIPKLRRNYELNTIADILKVPPSIVYQVYNDMLSKEIYNEY